jgi:hypothetical protein
MDASLLLDNLLNPAILFFFLGMLAALARSDLEIPQPLPKFFSLYLLIAIGLKGGAGLRESGLTSLTFTTLGAALVMSMLVPVAAFAVLRRRLDAAHAAAVAATYGSVSAVTFIAATALLREAGIAYGGQMVAALALMESPAIIIGVALARRYGAGTAPGEAGAGSPSLLREAFLNGSVFLLIGSLAIGVLIGDKGQASLSTFTDGMFKGILCLFLLDMGLVSARRLGQLRALGAFAIGFALIAPIVQGLAGVLVARLIGLGAGDALLFAVLCGSASYIAVPAAIRHAIPAASPGVYVTMALGITFPFNILAGMPLLFGLIRALWE